MGDCCNPCHNSCNGNGSIWSDNIIWIIIAIVVIVWLFGSNDCNSSCQGSCC